MRIGRLLLYFVFAKPAFADGDEIALAGERKDRFMKRNLAGKFIVLANFFAIVFMVYVTAVSAGYTVLLGDDYTHGVRVDAFHVPFFQYLGASFRYMKELYLDWQGTYFAMFLQALLSPVNNFGLPQLRVVMVLNALLFFGSLFGVYFALTGFILPGKERLPARLTVFTIVLFSILDANVFTEIFFWYSGAVSYSIPFSFLLLGLICFLWMNRSSGSVKRKNVLAVCSSLLLFLASGGSLAVSGTGCYAVLLFTIGFYLVSGKISRRNMIVNGAGIAGALINVIAPGNFSRHTYNSGGNSWRVVQSVKWTVKTVWSEIGRLTKETMFGVMLILMILAGIYFSNKLQLIFNVYGLISVLALATGYVTAFPVAFGYSGPEFPNRCYFILDVVLALSLLNFAVFIGCSLDRFAGLCTDRKAWAVLFIVAFASFLFAPQSVADSAIISMAKSMHNGSYRNYYEECGQVYDYLANCPEEDVAVYVPEYIDNFECFYLDEDADGWVNVGVAKFYHKNSVRKQVE